MARWKEPLGEEAVMLIRQQGLNGVSVNALAKEWKRGPEAIRRILKGLSHMEVTGGREVKEPLEGEDHAGAIERMLALQAQVNAEREKKEERERLFGEG